MSLLCDEIKSSSQRINSLVSCYIRALSIFYRSIRNHSRLRDSSIQSRPAAMKKSFWERVFEREEKPSYEKKLDQIIERHAQLPTADWFNEIMRAPLDCKDLEDQLMRGRCVYLQGRRDYMIIFLILIIIGAIMVLLWLLRKRALRKLIDVLPVKLFFAYSVLHRRHIASKTSQEAIERV